MLPHAHSMTVAENYLKPCISAKLARIYPQTYRDRSVSLWTNSHNIGARKLKFRFFWGKCLTFCDASSTFLMSNYRISVMWWMSLKGDGGRVSASARLASWVSFPNVLSVHELLPRSWVLQLDLSTALRETFPSSPTWMIVGKPCV